jgi:transposase
MLQSLAREIAPDASSRLDFEPGEAAQVDFGRGPDFVDVLSGLVIKTWFFVMTLAFSRHQYAEFVLDQTVETWLSCHRRAFEWFGGVAARIIIDNPKCAITRCCSTDPTAQRAYAECAEAYGFKISPCPPRDPQKKGIVESGVKYIKRAFVPLREFREPVPNFVFEA